MGRLPDVTEEEWLACDSFNRKIVEEFLRQSHMAIETLKQYKSALRIFTRWVKDECENKPFHKLKTRHGLAYQNYLIDAGLSNKGVKFKRAACSSLMGFIETFYDDEYPEFRNIYNKKVPSPGTAPKREKVPLTPEQLNTLLTELEKRGLWQQVCYIKFSYISGCRRAEARQLLKEVVNYEKMKDKPYYLTHTVRGKGRGREGKQIKLTLDDDAMNAVKKWLEVRGEDDCPYVFITKNENGDVVQIGPNTFNYWCSEIFSEILGVRCHPHQFRVSRASNMVIYENKDIKNVKALLNHENISTSELYVVKPVDDDLDGAY